MTKLRYRAVVAWAAFALSVVLLWGEHQFRVLHPWSLLFIFLLIITFAAAFGGFFRGLWRTCRGPQRVRAFGCASTSDFFIPSLIRRKLASETAGSRVMNRTATPITRARQESSNQSRTRFARRNMK
jgi:hypothetical protein